MSPSTHPEVRPQDRPLQEDVRYLASSLGQVIKRLEGDAVFRAVEDIRSACRGRRRGEASAPDLDTLLAKVSDLPLKVAAPVARAFTLFFFLINTAEQVHRVRRRHSYEDGAESAAQPASIGWAFEKLKAGNRNAGEVREYLRELEVRPVLTAHPTEATRRTLLQLQARLADALLKLGDTASALRWANHSLSIAPRDAASRVVLGDVLFQHGERAAAEAEWRTALEFDATNYLAAMRLNRLTRALAQPRKER